MGKDQIGGVDNLAAKVNKIEVDGAGTVPDGSDPSKDVLDLVHPPGEVEGIKRRLKNRHLIEELELNEFIRNVNRLGLKDRTRLFESRLGQDRQGIQRPP